jgi:hypothetical protein
VRIPPAISTAAISPVIMRFSGAVEAVLLTVLIRRDCVNKIVQTTSE